MNRIFLLKNKICTGRAIASVGRTYPFRWLKLLNRLGNYCQRVRGDQRVTPVCNDRRIKQLLPFLLGFYIRQFGNKTTAPPPTSCTLLWSLITALICITLDLELFRITFVRMEYLTRCSTWQFVLSNIYHHRKTTNRNLAHSW